MKWPDIIGSVALVVAWLKRRKQETCFVLDIEEINTFKKLVEETKCPSCEQSNTFKLKDFSRSSKGWQAVVECTNCLLEGVLNSEGYTFKGLNQKGRTAK